MIGHREDPSDRVAAAAEALSVLGTVALIIWLPFLTRHGRWPIMILVAAAVLLGSAGVLVDLIGRRRVRGAHGADVCEPPTDGASVTSVIVLGAEPPELQQHTITLARRSGPCVVLSTTPEPAVAAGLDVGVVTGPTVAAALDAAVHDIGTDAILLLSGRAVPAIDGARAVAGLLDDDHPWAVGRTRPFNQDRFTPDSGGRISAELRRRATASGLALWEPNATIVRTDALRRDGLPERRPRGAWLRTRSSEGAAPVIVDDVVALVASPASAATFWPDSFAQQRGAAADAAAAVRTERGLDRLLALLLVARESFAWSLLAWLVVLFGGTVSGELPLRTVHGAVPALLATVLGLRWYGLHRSLGVPLRPLTDLRSTVDRIPGSIAALPSVLVARVRPAPRRVSVRPLLWAAVLSAAVLGTALVDHAPDAQMTMPAVLAALLTLVVLWALCIQVLAQRGWERTTFRVDMSLPVRIGELHGRLLDGSPAGMAVSMDDGPAAASLPDGPLTVEVQLGDASTLELPATAAWCRMAHGRRVLGLSLSNGDGDAMAAWAAQLLRSAGHVDATTTARHGAPSADRDRQHDHRRGSPRHTAAPLRRPLTERLGDVVGIAVAIVLSMALLGVLGAAMLGLQFAVVRSASMSPTIAQGSVVISESVPVDGLRPGDVITRPGTADSGPVTHRLLSAHPVGASTTMVTRGDANTATESWSVPTRSTLQRVRWVVPSVGDAVSAARSNLTTVIGVVLVLGLLGAAIRLPGRDRTEAGPRPATT